MLEYMPDRNTLNRMSKKELERLSSEIRSFLVEKVSRKGGHLSSNLGAVELSLALFSVFDIPRDKVIFDVGHQSYVWKMLTGRMAGFDKLRDFGGMSGFPKRSESPADVFDTGHSSTSISAGIGLVKARELKNEDHYVVSVIGDGSMTGGEAYEALNNAARLKSNFIIVLNDNEMSISENVGGLSRYLTSLRAGSRYNRTKQSVAGALEALPGGEKVIDRLLNVKDSVKEIFVPQGMLFENMGVTYLGPVDGHNIDDMKKIFERAKGFNRAVLIHVKTVKGKGYKLAEEHPVYFHGVDPFDKNTGKKLKESVGPSWSEVFGNWMTEKAETRPELAAVTAAMGRSVGLRNFSHTYPDRFFDVGIAEQHAVTFAAGLAVGGMHPVAAVFSSFLQRGFDQIVHDVCMQDLPVIFAVDRAGITGRDGETHQGAFDIAYMRPVPNLVMLEPKNAEELRRMLDFALDYPHPVSVRYGRGAAYTGFSEYDAPIVYGKAEIIKKGCTVALLAAGSMMKTAMEVCEKLESEGFSPTLVNMRFLKPLDTELLDSLPADHDLIVTMEDGAVSGGFGEACASYLAEKKDCPQIIEVGIPDAFVPQGDVPELKKMVGMDAESVYVRILERLRP